MAKMKLEITTLESLQEQEIDYIEIAYGNSYDELEKLDNKLIKTLNTIIIDYRDGGRRIMLSLAIIYNIRIGFGK